MSLLRQRWSAVVLALAVSACGREPGPPTYRVELTRVVGRGWKGQRLDEGTARDLVREALAASPSLVATGGETSLAGYLRYDVQLDQAGSPYLVLDVGLEAPPHLRSVLPDGLGVPVSLERGDGTVDLRRDMPLAARRLGAIIESQLALASEQPGAVARLLGSEDPELVLLGLQWVHDHRPKQVADAVAALVTHPEERVALLAVECVGLVGAPRHAAILVRSARLADRAHAHRTYEALASLGGPQARGFLQFAARNEDDPALAAAAKRALDELARRAPRGGPASPVLQRGHRR